MAGIVLEVRPLDSRGIEFGPREFAWEYRRLRGGEVAEEDQEAWERIIPQSVAYAFQDRATCLIERIYSYDSPLLLRTLHISPTRVLDAAYVLVGFVPSFSSELVDLIALSGEFEIGFLWLTSLPYEDTNRMYVLMRAMRESSGFFQVPVTDEEVLLRIADGDRVWWLNAPRSTGEIVQELRRIADSVGWVVDAQALEGQW